MVFISVHLSIRATPLNISELDLFFARQNVMNIYKFEAVAIKISVSCKRQAYDALKMRECYGET